MMMREARAALGRLRAAGDTQGLGKLLNDVRYHLLTSREWQEFGEELVEAIDRLTVGSAYTLNVCDPRPSRAISQDVFIKALKERT